MKSPFQSIRWRMQAWHALVLLIAITAFCLTTYRLAWNNQLRAIDQNIYSKEGKLSRAILRARAAAQGLTIKDEENPAISPAIVIASLKTIGGKVPSDVAPIFEGTEPGYAYFSYRNAAGDILLQSPNLPEGIELLPMPKGRYSDEWRTRDHSREVLRSSTPGLRSLVGRDISPELESIHRFGWSLGGIGFAIWVVCLVGGWWIAGNAIRPITAISRTAARIAEGNLEERISEAGTESELDQLGRVLNHTFDRLQSGIEQQKQFVADASHELRTPVTILLSETQRILKNDRRRTPEELFQVIKTCGDAGDRMRRLIESLLVLARQDAHGAGPLREECDLSEILRETVEQLEPLAAARSIRLKSDLRPAACLGYPAALGILASNLIANAIHHNHEGGEVVVSCDRAGESATFSVADDGPGIPPGDRQHVFERFYRADKSRSAASGHTGLGLAIAKAVVDNHGGRITVRTTSGEGSVFDVTLPACQGAPGVSQLV
jgi:signal transduction histidine kinase